MFVITEKIMKRPVYVLDYPCLNYLCNPLSPPLSRIIDRTLYLLSAGTEIGEKSKLLL